MHQSVKHILALCLLTGLAAPAFAGGFQIGEMATRASGMASAFTAVADDASAAWYNPAGVGFTQGSRLMAGSDAMIVPGTKYAPNAFSSGVGGAAVTAGTRAKNKTVFVPHAYYAYMDASSHLGGAIGINSPFGLVTDWPANGPFASKNTYSRIQMWMVNPSVVYQLSEHLSLAAGADYAYLNNVDLNNTNQILNGHGDGWGGNAALLYKAGDFSAGISYRSRIKVDIKGTAVAQSTLRTLGGTNTGATSRVTLPDQVDLGLAYRPDKDWLLSLDVDWVNWKTYDAIRITYDSAAYRTAVSTLQGLVGAAATGSTNEPRNWKATTALRVGMEWACHPDMRVRFGYVFDPTPSSDVYFSPSTPDSDRHIFSIGYGYDVNAHTTLDLMYGYVYFVKRQQTASPTTPVGSPDSVKNGDYRSQVHILAASMSYRF
jgi:long-chain fatty acid transport protein